MEILDAYGTRENQSSVSHGDKTYGSLSAHPPLVAAQPAERKNPRLWT